MAHTFAFVRREDRPNEAHMSESTRWVEPRLDGSHRTLTQDRLFHASRMELTCSTLRDQRVTDRRNRRSERGGSKSLNKYLKTIGG